MFEADELAASSRRAAHVDVAVASDDELCAAAITFERARASLDAAEAHVLAELEQRGVCDRDIGLGTASWLADRAHAARPTIAARLRLGLDLRRLPAVDAALTEGELTFDHARALGAAANPRIADDIAACQDQLIDLARQAPYAVWRRDLGVLVDLLDQDGGHDPERDLARNHLHLSALAGDQVVLSGELVGEAALELSQAVEAEADRLWRQFRDDHEVGAIATIPRRSTLMALALVSLCRKGRADDHDRQAPVADVTLVLDAREPTPEDTPEPAPDEPDAAPGAAPASDAGARAGHDIDVPTPVEPRWPLHLGPLGLTTLDGDPLDLTRYEHLLCDAAFRLLLVDSLGVPLDLGRSVRRATPAQRRALAVRDGGCVFPGCEAPPGWCDAHHVETWHLGGLTDLARLALLCRHHHGVTHRLGWQMRAGPDQTFSWTTPAGLVLLSQRQRGRPARLGLTVAA